MREFTKIIKKIFAITMCIIILTTSINLNALLDAVFNINLSNISKAAYNEGLSINWNGGNSTFSNTSLGGQIVTGGTIDLASGNTNIAITGDYSFSLAGSAGGWTTLNGGGTAYGGRGRIINTNAQKITGDTSLTVENPGTAANNTWDQYPPWNDLTGQVGNFAGVGHGADGSSSWYQAVFGQGGNRAKVSYNENKVVAGGGGAGAVMHYCGSNGSTGFHTLNGVDADNPVVNWWGFESDSSESSLFRGTTDAVQIYACGKGEQDGYTGTIGSNTFAAGTGGISYVQGFNASYGYNDSTTGYVTMTCHAKYFTVNNPTKSGYIFNGWTTEGSVSVSSNNGGSVTFKKTAGNAKLTANWTPITYTVTYNGNGATGGSTANSSHTYDQAGNLSTNGYTKTGHLFNVWNTAANGTGTSYSSGQSVANLTATNGATITLYAQWTPITYKVRYNPNNPNNNAQVTGTMNDSTFTYTRGENLRDNAFARNAWTFVNWNTVANGTGTARENKAYVLNWTTTNNAIINLYAQWRLNLKNITGQVNWNDQNNKYSSRPANVTVTLHHDTDGNIAILKEADTNPVTVAGNSSYTFSNVQTQKESNNSNYNYSVTQNIVPGYKTTVEGGQDVANISGYNASAANKFAITNTLVTPTYTSNITYTPIDTFENRLLKNGKVKLTATAQTSSESDVRAGLHNGQATFTIDSGITLDTSKIKVSFYDASVGRTINLANYTITNNVITVNFGENSNGISEKGDKITIEVEGTLNKLGSYSSSIAVTGKLRDVSVNNGLTEAQRNTEINLGTVTSKTAGIQVDYQTPKANIKITKHDSITEQNLTDATFTLYEWNGSSYVEKETISDTNGDGIYESKVYEWNKTTEGKYKIVETGLPQNHKNITFTMIYTLDQLQTENYTVTPDYSNTNGISDACPGHTAKKYEITYSPTNPDDFDSTNGIVENEPYKVKARIDLLDSETRKQIQNEATFKIYEWDNTTDSYKIYTSYTTGKEVEMTRLEDKTYIAGEWLYYTPTNEGKYRIIEETAPTGYYGDYSDDEAQTKRTYDINVLDLVGTNGQSNEMTITLTNDNGYFTNRRTKGEIKVNKVDKETKDFAQGDATLEGAVYEIYAKNNIYHSDGITTNYLGETALLYKPDELVETKQTDSEGKITFDDLECGIYYIKEKTASVGYLLDGNTYEVEVEYRGQDILVVKEERTLEEKVKKQGFQIYKIKETDRTEYEGLQNAGFTIYRINSLSIVKDGKISKNADGSYTLNDEQAKKDESLTKLANKNGTYNIIDLIDYYYKIKYTEENMAELPQDENSYYMYNNMHEEKVKDYSSTTEGIQIQELTTDIDGYIRSPELAYGEYIVLETTTPKNLETAKPFYINIQNDLRTPQKLKFIVDANFETKVKIYKKDIDTGKAILQSGTKYVIYNAEGDLMTIKTWDASNGYVEYGTLENPFVTGEEGYLITPMKLPVGTYTIKELSAPNGYVLNGYEGYSKNGQGIENPSSQVTFRVATNGIYYTDDYLDTNVIVVNQYNKAQVGTLTLTTTGEYVQGVEQDKNGNYNFTYETKPIEGVTYQIKAKEEIISQDGRNSILYAKDKVVKTITSNSEGIAYADNLPQGKYYIVQTVAGNGFTLNEETKEFEIKYGTNNKELEVGTDEWKTSSQETPVIYLEESYQNQRQDLKITIQKQDGETNEGIKGTVIGLYAKENIVNQATGETILQQDTLVLQKTTDEQGQIVIEGNLPLNNYYVKEITATPGYIKNNQTNNIDGTYDTSQIAVQEINTTLTNYKTNINIRKTDTEEKVLPGATLNLRESNGNVVENWETTEELKNIRGLKTNEQYSIVEVKPADGYVTANPINFTITEEGIVETEAKHEDNTITMEDETTKLRVELIDKVTKEFVRGADLKIVKVVEETDDQGNVITDEEGNKVTREEEVAKWTTEDAYYIEKLAIGHYKLIEEKAPTDQGYVQVEEVEFDINDTKEVQIIQMLQERTKLQINVIDKDSLEQIEGATLQIIRKTEVTDEEGNKTTQEEIIKEFETTKEAYYTEKLPVGTYTLREVNSPTDRGYVTIEDKEFKIEETKEIQIVEVRHDVAKLQVNLVDAGNDNKQIPGATLQIINKETEEVIREFVTSEEPYETEKLPIGNYILKQVNPVIEEGQVTTKEVEFGIIDTRELQTVTMTQEYTKLEVELIDKETKELLQGVNLQIVRITKEGEEQKEEVVREFTTGEENYKTERLPIGNYILRELPNQTDAIQEKGYATLEDITFEIKDLSDVQKVTAEQDYTKLEVELLDKETKEKVQGVKFEIIRTTSEVYEEENEEKEQIHEEKVGEFTTGEENYTTQRLPVGTYILRESKDQKEALLEKGYVTLEDINFEVKDSSEVQKVTVEQDYTKLEVEILDKETLELLTGVKFEIYKLETKEDGTEETKEKIREFETGEENYQTIKLGVGKYILHELPEQTESLLNKGYVTIEDITFEIKDTKEVQKVTVEQATSKLEIQIKDKKTKENVPGITVEIIKITEDGKEEVVKEITTGKENLIIEKLPMGEYILREKEEGIIDKGYIRTEDIYFKIIDTVKNQKVEIEQDYTKLEVRVVDKETKEQVIGATMVIQDKEGNEITERWTSTKEPKRIDKLPVGKYILVQIEAPGLRGYVKSEPVEFEVKETGEIQVVEMEEDYTKITISIKDEISDETIKDVEIIVKDEKGNEVIRIKDKEGLYEIEKLPTGKYVIETENVPYGYKNIHEEIEITQTNKGQLEIKAEREPFDMEVKEWIASIERNGAVQYTNKKEEQSVKKLDIKDKKINTEDIRITYKIRVKNISKITGQVGKVEVNVPQGMKYVAEDNKSYWKQEGGKIVSTGLAGRDIKEGAYAELEITLRWRNGLENFGTKATEVEIKEVTSDIGYKEINLENNIAKASDIIIGVSTGEMSLVWACWLLLITLILIEIYVTKKLHIKVFKIKDRTLKYRKKK